MLAGYSPWGCKESDMTYRMCMLAKLLQSCPTLCNPCMGFSRQEHWSGLPCPSPGDLPYPKIKPVSLKSSALAGGFFATSATRGSPFFSLLPILYHAKKKNGGSVILGNPGGRAACCSLECHLWTSIMNISWKLIRNAESRVTPHAYIVRICMLTRSPGNSHAY